MASSDGRRCYLVRTQSWFTPYQYDCDGAAAHNTVSFFLISLGFTLYGYKIIKAGTYHGISALLYDLRTANFLR